MPIETNEEKAGTELAEKLTKLWEEDTSLWGMPERTLANDAITIIKEMKDISAASLWLERLAGLTPETFSQFEKDFKEKMGNDPDATFSYQLQVQQFLTLARWISGSVGDPYNPYKSFSHSDEEPGILQKIKNKIIQSSHLMSSHDPALQRRFFEAVNDDDFDALKALLEEKPYYALDTKNTSGFDLLTLAYLRRAYLTTSMPEKEMPETKKSAGTQTFLPSHSKESLIHPLETRTEADRQKENEKIFLLLLEKTKMDPLAQVKEKSKIHFNPSMKTLLSLSANSQTAPSELIFYLLLGADPNAKDKEGKTALDYLTKINPDQGNARLNKTVLQMGVTELFHPKNYKLLDEILQDAKEDKNSLFNEIDKFRDNFKFDTPQAAGLLYYHLPIEGELDARTILLQGHCIVLAGDEIAKINKIDASHYYRKAALFGNPEAMQKLGQFYHFNANPRSLMEAIEWYVKSYSSKLNYPKDDSAVVFLKLIAIDEKASTDEKNAAISELQKIYESRWKQDFLPHIILLEKIEFYSLIKNNAHINPEEKRSLLQQIKESSRQVLQNVSKDEEAELLYRLLPHDLIEKKDIPEALEKIHACAVRIFDRNNFKAMGYLRRTSSMGHADSAWELATIFGTSHFSYLYKKDYLEALKFYAAYVELENKKNGPENFKRELIAQIKIIINETKEKNDFLTKKLAIKELVHIYNLCWEKKLLGDTIAEKIDLLVYLEKMLAGKTLLKKLNEQILENLFKSNLDDTSKGNYLSILLNNSNIHIAARTKAMIEGKKEFIATASRLLTQKGNTLLANNKSEKAARYFELVKEWKDRYTNEDINELLTILNQSEDSPDEKKDESKKIDDWVEKYGDAATFSTIDQNRHHLISHRIAESIAAAAMFSKNPPKESTSLRNPIAKELEQKLIDKWKTEKSDSSTKMLRNYYNKKLEFFKAIGAKDEIQTVKKELSILKPGLFSWHSLKKQLSTSNDNDRNAKQKKTKQ